MKFRSLAQELKRIRTTDPDSALRLWASGTSWPVVVDEVCNKRGAIIVTFDPKITVLAEPKKEKS